MEAEILSFGPTTWIENEVGTGALTTTKTAPGAGKRLLIHSVTISAQAAPSAAVRAEVREGASVLEYIDIPAAQYSPIHITFGKGLRVAENTLFEVYVPSQGVAASVTVRGTVMRV